MMLTEYGSVSSIVASEEEEEKQLQLQLIVTTVFVINVVLVVILIWLMMAIVIDKTQKEVKLSYRAKKRRKLVNLNNPIKDSDATCKSELRMNRHTFCIICEMLRDIRVLTGSRYMSLEEIVAMFLYTLAHYFKNRTIGSYFYQSGEGVSRNFHRCLLTVLKLHTHLLKKPTLIIEDCEDRRWKCFKVM